MIIGVLVAVSIPIFTSQLEKGRLATNQANARAAYAATVAAYLDDDSLTTATYDTATGSLTSTASTTGTAITGTDISAWTTTTPVGSSTLGKTVYEKWTVIIGTDGVTGYVAE